MNIRFGTMALLLVSQWRWIAAGTAITATIAVFIVVLQPPAYTASVDIVPKRARTEVAFDTRIRTITSDGAAQPANAQGAPSLAAVSAERRQTLAQLVRNPDVESAVRQELGDTLPAGLRAPGRLLRSVRAKLVPRSEIITITVDAPDPVLAEQITATWARAYERKVTQLYATSSFGSLKLDEELIAAKRKYDLAEQELTTFQATSPLDEYSRQLETKRQTVQVMLKELTQEKVQRLAYLYSASQRLEALLGDFQALRQQLNGAPDSSAAASNALALTYLKTQAFASSAPLPAGLQVQLPIGTAQTTIQQQRSDVAATIQALSEWRTRLQQEYRARLLEMQLSEQSTPEEARQALQARLNGVPGADVLTQILSESSDPELAQSIHETEQTIRNVHARVSELSARHRNILLERDISWETYTTILKKAEETRVATAVGTGHEVSVASAEVIAEPRSRRLFLITPLAGFLGAALAASLVLLPALPRSVADFLGNQQEEQHGHVATPTRAVEDFAA